MLTEMSLLLTLINLHNRKLNSCQVINKTVCSHGGTPVNLARVEWLALLISSSHFTRILKKSQVIKLQLMI